MIPETTKEKYKALLMQERERIEQDLRAFTRDSKTAPGGHDSVMEE